MDAANKAWGLVADTMLEIEIDASIHIMKKVQRKQKLRLDRAYNHSRVYDADRYPKHMSYTEWNKLHSSHIRQGKGKDDMSERKLRKAAAMAAFQLSKNKHDSGVDLSTDYPVDNFDINSPELVAMRIRIAAQQAVPTGDPSGRRWSKGRKGRGTTLLTSSE